MAAVGVVGVGYLSWVATLGADTLGLRCPISAVLGIDCPGCGATRAMAALVDGNLAAAVDHHLLIPVAAAVLAWWWVAAVTSAVTSRQMWHPLGARWSAVTVGLTVAVFTVARNVGPGAGWLSSGISG